MPITRLNFSDVGIILTRPTSVYSSGYAFLSRNQCLGLTLRRLLNLVDLALLASIQDRFAYQGAQSASIASDVYSGPYVLHALCRVHYRRNFSIRPQIHEAKHACPLCNINSNNYSVVRLSQIALYFASRFRA